MISSGEGEEPGRAAERALPAEPVRMAKRGQAPSAPTGEGVIPDKPSRNDVNWLISP